MPPNPYRFAVLTHLDVIADMMREYCDSREYSLAFKSISYDTSVLGVQRVLEEGYDVVLVYSAFGLSALREIGHSLVLIQKTDMDIIHTLQKARGISTEVALTVHHDENIDVDSLEKLLDMRIHTISYGTVDELIDNIHKAFDQGINTLVGGGVSALTATQRGARFFRIMPNAYSLRMAMQQAIGIAKAKREDHSSRSRFVEVLRLFNEGVVCVDQNMDVFFCNEAARRMLKIRRGSQEKQLFQRYFTELMFAEVLAEGAPRLDSIVTINKEQVVVTTLPVSIHPRLNGAVAFLRDADTLRNLSGHLRAAQNRRGFTAHYRIEDIKGVNPDIQRLRTRVQLYAPHSASVFIHGETGTGKELVAQALHAASERSDKPFVAVNCAALPDSLLESELFGYEEGAFTGARRGGKTGLFELAHTGTLFLDEVGDIGPGAQLRLLRVLETRELMRVGGSHIIPVDIRVISASHKSLTELAHSGRFRQDLCYRLAVLRIQIPPLRRRLMDIPLLLDELLQKYNNVPQSLSLRMLKAMEAYHWPGNIRELKSFMESYLILLDKEAADEALFLQLLEEWAREGEYHKEPQEQAFPVPEVGGSLKNQLAAARREIALSTVKQCAWNKNLAAKRLGISYNTLWRILSEETSGHDMA